MPSFPRLSAMSRRTKILTAAGAVVVVAGGATAGVLIANSGGGEPAHVASSPSPSKTGKKGNSKPPPPPPTKCPLTGLPAKKNQTPNQVAVAVKVDNVPDAQPQAGLDKADLVVQETVEGGLTRLFAVFQCNKAAQIGPIRSARTSDGDLIKLLHQAVFAYSGANPAAIRKWTGTVDAALISWDSTPGFFHVDGSRPAPHNVFSSTTTLRREGLHRKSGLGAPPPAFSYGDPQVSGSKAGSVSIHWPAASAGWNWSGHVWRRVQDGGADMLTDGQQVTATNVVIMSIKTIDTGIRDVLGNPSPDDVVIGRGQAWVLRDGRVYHGVWVRAQADDGYTFRDNHGKALPLRPGNTWLELLPSGVPTFSK